MEFLSAIGLLPILVLLFEHENRLHVKFDWASVLVCCIAGVTAECTQVPFFELFLHNGFNGLELGGLVCSRVQPVEELAVEFVVQDFG
jgi:hypothetical protein